MSTTLLDIRQALEPRVLTALTASPVSLDSSDVVFPNVRYQPRPGAAHARVDHLHAKTVKEGAGTNGFIKYPGILQVRLYFPEGAGTASVVTAAQALIDSFLPGTKIISGFTAVEIKTASIDAFLREDEWVVLPVSIDWEVYTQPGGPSVVPGAGGELEPSIAASKVTLNPTVEGKSRVQAALEVLAQLATGTQSGRVSTLAQTFAGLKTFLAGIALSAKLVITNITSGENAVEIPVNTKVAWPSGSLLHDGVRHIFSGTARAQRLEVSTTGGIAPLSDGVIPVGGATARFGDIFAVNFRGSNYVDDSGNFRVRIPNASFTTIFGRQADGPTAVGVVLDAAVKFEDATAKLASIRNAGVEKAYVLPFGGIVSLAGSGEDGFSIPNAGSRFRIGPGTQSFLYSDSVMIGTWNFRCDNRCYAVTFSGVGINNPTQFQSTRNDVADAVAFDFDTDEIYADPTVRVISIKTGGVERCRINKDGEFEVVTLGKGFIMTSDDGLTRKRLKLSNAGALVLEDV